eukprot:ctg_451.g222
MALAPHGRPSRRSPCLSPNSAAHLGTPHSNPRHDHHVLILPLRHLSTGAACGTRVRFASLGSRAAADPRRCAPAARPRLRSALRRRRGVSHGDRRYFGCAGAARYRPAVSGLGSAVERRHVGSLSAGGLRAHVPTRIPGEQLGRDGYLGKAEAVTAQGADAAESGPAHRHRAVPGERQGQDAREGGQPWREPQRRMSCGGVARAADDERTGDRNEPRSAGAVVRHHRRPKIRRRFHFLDGTAVRQGSPQNRSESGRRGHRGGDRCRARPPRGGHPRKRRPAVPPAGAVGGHAYPACGCVRRTATTPRPKRHRREAEADSGIRGTTLGMYQAPGALRRTAHLHRQDIAQFGTQFGTHGADGAGETIGERRAMTRRRPEEGTRRGPALRRRWRAPRRAGAAAANLLLPPGGPCRRRR